MHFRHLQHTLFILFSSVSFGLSAASIGTVTLDNGATVQLNDDHTWEYIAVNTEITTKADNTIIPVVIASTTVIPANTEQTAKDKSSLVRSGLLNTAVKSDVKVTFTEATWRERSLGLKFALSSNNAEGVVIVKVAATFYDDQAKQISEQTFNVWQASYRLPNTYLRKGETRDSRIIWVDGIDKANWADKLLSLKIVEIETR
ncbi:DUF3157 family protein [Psychromonas sp. GE-S-Ul-11]|uniref:DUF3157 family protein n=1 Tax=Psychromonas sp. GE-S-Ul-11 TaxID=3241170 RepID=UPI00390C92B8